MLYPVILAGGSGKRLWPLSSLNCPKQFQALIGDQTLLQMTYERLLHIFDKDKIFVVTNRSIVSSVTEQIAMPIQQILVEPEAKGTAVAIGWAALNIAKIDPQAALITINSDHFVEPIERYRHFLQVAEGIITKQPEHMLLFGVRPRYPETGYGYIETAGDSGLYDRVVSLKEKPDLATAESYLQSGKYLWSSGIFVFKAAQLLKWYQQFLPDIYHVLLHIDEDPKSVDKEYSRLQDISIDYGLLEKMDNMLVLPVDFSWADIGHWRSLRDILQKGDENVSNVKHLLALDSKNNLLYSYSDKLIATVGVEDMILVETDKIIFLCPAKKAQEVKRLLAKIKDKGWEEYL